MAFLDGPFAGAVVKWLVPPQPSAALASKDIQAVPLFGVAQSVAVTDVGRCAAMFQGTAARVVCGRERGWDLVFLADVGSRLIVTLKFSQVDSVARVDGVGEV